MSRANPNKNKLPPFVPLLIGTIDSPAWRAMSHGARSLYGCLKRRVPRGRNTAYLSYRDAADEMGCSKTTVERGYQELQHYGFIVLVRHGCLGVDGKGKAALWRLTELGNTSKTSAAGLPEAPTRDFLTWDGTRYRRDRSGVDYANLTRRKNRIPSPHQGQGVPPSRTVVSPHQGHPKAEVSPHEGHIESNGCPPMRDITSKPLPGETAVGPGPALAQADAYQPSCLGSDRSKGHNGSDGSNGFADGYPASPDFLRRSRS